MDITLSNFTNIVVDNYGESIIINKVIMEDGTVVWTKEAESALTNPDLTVVLELSPGGMIPCPHSTTPKFGVIFSRNTNDSSDDYELAIFDLRDTYGFAIGVAGILPYGKQIEHRKYIEYSQEDSQIIFVNGFNCERNMYYCIWDEMPTEIQYTNPSETVNTLSEVAPGSTNTILVDRKPRYAFYLRVSTESRINNELRIIDFVHESMYRYGTIGQSIISEDDTVNYSSVIISCSSSELEIKNTEEDRCRMVIAIYY